MLRVSLGLVFLAFGALKFVPDLSPAQDLTMRTVETLSFGLVPGNVVLFPGRLFGQGFFAPTLEAQYVFKDVVLVAAGLVVAPAAFGIRSTSDEQPEHVS